MFKRILLAADGSKHSIKAAAYSIRLAEKFDAVVDVVYVVDSDTARKDSEAAVDYGEVERKQLKRIEHVQTLMEKSNIIYGIHLLYGDPGQTIADFVEERECDTVVIGNRGLNAFRSLVMGSVSQQVVKLVDCPVLVIK